MTRIKQLKVDESIRLTQIPSVYPLWERFQLTVSSVLASFGMPASGPEFEAEFEISRSGEHRVSIVKMGKHRPQAEFGINLSSAHTFEHNGDRWPVPPECQYSGWLTPLGLSMALALYPLVHSNPTRIDRARMMTAAAGFDSYPCSAPEAKPGGIQS